MKATRGCLTVIGGLVVVIVIVAVVVGASTKSDTGTTSSPALVNTTGSSHHAKRRTVHAHTQTFKGDGTENIGTVHVAVDSTLHWSCPSCANENFQIFNDPADGDLIAVNALGPTSGKTVVSADTYHKVEINTEGQAWTIRIVPGT